MKICVVGPGALGCLFGAFLAKAGHEVWLLDHRPERARRIAAQGITLHDRRGVTTVVPVRATAEPTQAAPVSLVLLCVKSGAVVCAARNALPALAADGLFIALQNGIAHHDRLSKLGKRWALGVTAQGAYLLDEGVVQHGGEGATFLGFLSSSNPEAEARLHMAAKMLSQAGIPAIVADDILVAAWNKLIVNVGINALTVVEDCANGELLLRPHALAVMEAAVGEAILVASACGVNLSENQLERVQKVCRDTGANFSSMLQDIRAGRSTEVDAINGEIVRLAERVGIPATTNRFLVSAVKEREAVSA